MGRKKRIRSGILTLVLFIAACSVPEDMTETEVLISFSGTGMQSRSIDPDENKISDISLMIFDETGAAEECIWLQEGITDYCARLVTGKKYILCACANFGYQVYADNMDELEDIRYHMAYPDEYSMGIPMYAYTEFTVEEGYDEISIPLERLMAKISIRMDRGRLSDDVEMYVRSIKIGNCPRSACVFRDNRVDDEDGCFPAGFSRYGLDAENLNRTSGRSLSKAVSLYMLENMQGRMDESIQDDRDKVFDDYDHRRKVCSFIEMEIEYMSDRLYSGSRGLVYRFYLGADRNDLNVERNCHYNIIVAPEDDGLSDDGWRVDKSDLTEYGPVSFEAYPSDYIRGDIGDRIHIWCEFSPPGTPFDVGTSYMEDDKAEGIYDYEIDDDGHGATLTLTGPGTGLIYMEAGDPINDAALFIIEVNMP